MEALEKVVKILDITPITHDVKAFRLEKPEGYTFQPGQATELSINTPEGKAEKRPFTFTSLQTDPFLEFTIKAYPDHNGVTEALHRLQPGDELVVRDVWGAIEYKGPGYFIAGGAGITPFLAIFRELSKQKELAGNILFFSNKRREDIINEGELKEKLGSNAHFLLTRESSGGYEQSRIDSAFIKKNVQDYTRRFYVCGPDNMVSDVTKMLEDQGANTETIVFEK